MDLDDLQSDQAGLVTREQLATCGLTPHDVRRLVRRRLLTRIHRGVYLNHTGDPSWLQRAWAAVLATQPSALSHESALRAWEGPGRAEAQNAEIHIAVEHGRHLRSPDGVTLHRVRGLDDRVAWNLHPPRVRFAEALIDVAAAQQDPFAALGVLARGVGSRRTTAARLLTTCRSRLRLADRDWIEGVLADVAGGTCSVLEHGFLHRVEMAHGLPTASRQRRDVVNGRVFYRDNAYAGLVIELDGRVFHDSTSSRDRDAERDLDTAVAGDQTLRILYGQVFQRPCSTAAKVATILQRHGWQGTPTPCSSGCALPRIIGVA